MRNFVLVLLLVACSETATVTPQPDAAIDGNVLRDAQTQDSGDAQATTDTPVTTDTGADAAQCNPRVERLGTSWRALTAPSNFDVVRSAVATPGGGHLLLIATNYPQVVNIRTQIWRQTGETLADATPAILNNFSGDVVYEQGNALERLDDGTTFLSTTRSATGGVYTGRLYTLDGSNTMPIDVGSLNTESLGLLYHRGNTLFGGGEAGAEAVIFSRSGGVISRIEFAERALGTVTSITSSSNAMWASVGNGIYTVANTSTRMPLPQDRFGERAVFAHGTLYAVLARRALDTYLYRWDGSTWLEVCTPAEIRMIHPFNNELLVRSVSHLYLFDGSTWTQLPDGMNSAYGTRDALFGTTIGPGGTATISALVR